MAAFHFREAYNKRKKEEEAQGSAVRTLEGGEKKFNFRQAYEERIKAEEKANRPYAYEPPKTSPKVEQKRYNTQQEALQTGANVKDMEWYAREKAANRLSEYATYSDYLTGEVTRQKGGQSDAETARQTVTELNNWLNRSGSLLMQYAKEAAENGYQSKNTLNSRRMVMDDLAAQAGEIKTSLYANKDILGEKETENAVKAIDAQLNWNDGVNAFTKQKSEIMSQFANEDDYNRAIKDEEYRSMSHEERLKAADRLDAEYQSSVQTPKERIAEMTDEEADAYRTVLRKKASGKALTEEETAISEGEEVYSAKKEADRFRLLDKQILDEQESDYWDSLSAKEMQEQQKYFLSEIEKDMAAYENEESPSNQRYYLDEIQRMRGWYDNLYRREQIKEQQENFEAQSTAVQNALIEKAYAERVFGDDFQRIIERYDSVYGPDAKNYGDNDITKEKIDTFKKAQFDLNASGLSDEEIEEQMKYARRIANERYTQRRNEIISDYSTKNFGQGAFSSVMSVPANLIGGVEGLLASIGQYLENSTTGRYQEIDTNSEAFDLSNYSDAMRSSITENLGGGDSVLGFLYGTGMSMADFAALAPLGGSSSALVRALPSAVLGMSSATSTIKDTVERGGTTEQALVNGIFAGAAEMLCEKYSLESLFSLGNESNIKAVLKNVAKQTLTEGSEEAATDLVNFMADQIVMGDLSEYNLTKQAYIMQGMTEEDAAKRAAADFCKEMFVDFAGGALSGGVMGGLTSGIHYAKSDIRNAAKLADYEGQVRAEYNESYKPKGNMSYEEFVQQEAKRRLIEEAADSTIQKMEKREAKKQKALNKATEEDGGIKLAREAAERQMREADAKQSFPSDKVRFSEVGDDPIFRDADGKTVHENEISYKDENERAVYEAARNLDNVRAANAMINTYEKHNGEQTGGTDFADGYRLLYDAGKTADTYEQVMRFEGIARAANNIGEAAARSAFYSGQNVANQVFFSPEAEAKVLKSGGVLMNTSRAVSDDKTNFMLKVVDAVGKKYGRVFEVRDDLGSANGYYRESDNRIVLSLHAQDNAITRVAGHELTHFIQKNAPEVYRQMADVILTALKADPNYDYEGRAKWLKEHNPAGNADEEIVAESMFDALSNETTVKELLKTENRTFFEKVRDWIDEFIGYIDETIQRLKSRKQTGAEIRSLQKQTDVLKKANDLFYQALEETKSVGNTREIGDGVRYSVKEFAEQVDQIEVGTFPRGNHVYVGATPKILADVGLNGDLPMLTTAQHIRKAMLPKNDKTHQHGLTEAQIKALPQKIANPVMIMDSLDPSRNAVVVVTDMLDADGSPIIAAIKADGRGMFNDVEVDTNFVLSYYGRDGFNNFIDKNISADTFLYIDKTKSRNLSNQAKRQFFGKLDKYDFDIIIRKTNANVNVLNSENMSKNKEQAQGADNVNKFSIKDTSVISEEEFTQTKDFFGTTKNYDIAGYMLPDGVMLDFSGKHWGDASSTFRQVDHRDIWEVWEHDEFDGTEEMVNMIANGGIRLMPESNGINLAVMPTEKQLSALRGYINHFDGEIVVDIDEPGGDTIHSFEYGRGTASSKILGDIRTYFLDGTVPQKRELYVNQFRYSVKDNEEQVSEKALLRENEHLKRLVADVQKAIKKERLDIQYGSRETRIIEETARNYKKKYQSDLPEERIEQMLRGLYERISSGDFDSYTAFEISKGIAKQILDSSKTMQGEKRNEYAALRKYLRGHSVCIPASYKSDPFYRSVRRGLFGRIRIADAGVPLDQYIENVKNEFPNFISNSVLETESQIFEELFRLSTEAHKLFVDRKDRTNIINNFALDILQDRVTIPKQRSFGDTWYNEFKRVRRELSKELDNIETLERQYRDRERERIQKEEHDSLVRGIARSAKNLSRRLINPTDKQNIPIVYRVWVGETLSEIDFSKIRLDSSSQKNAELQEMMTRIHNMANWRNTKLTENQKNAMDESLEIDPEAKTIRERVRLQINQLYEQNGKRAVDLSIVDNETLKQINNILTSTLHTVTNYNKVLSGNHRMTISQMGEKTIADNYGKFKRRNAIQRMAKQLFQIDAASLETYLTGIGDVGTDIWGMFRQGEADKVSCIRSAQSFVEKAYADMPKNFRKALNNKELITCKFQNGTVSFTKQQIMELYALSRRKQAMQHIENGGIITGDMLSPVAVSEAELNRLFDERLTEAEKNFAARLQRYLSTEVSEWGNRVTRREFGYDKFTEENYWPIRADRRATKTSDRNATEDDGGLYALRNFGATKALNENAENAIRIGNLMDTFSDHVVKMATYNGYALVVRDAMGWFNYQNLQNRNVKSAIEARYGSGEPSKINDRNREAPGIAYFIKFMKDLNGAQGRDNTFAGQTAEKLSSRAKAAAVGANARVVVQQPTAVVRAFAVVEPKYFIGKPKKGAFAEAAEYSTAAQLKAWGFRENGLSTQFSAVLQGNSGFSERITNAAMWGAEQADAITWGRIWEACKRKTAAENPDMDIKSDEFLQTAGKLMDDVCYRTQVFDTLLCRTQTMRSDNAFLRLLVAFTAEPAKSYNMLLRAMMSGSKKEVIKTFLLTTLASVLATAAASAVSAGRDDDDYQTYGEKYGNAFLSDLADSVNPFASIPFVSGIVDKLTGNDYDTPSFYEQLGESVSDFIEYGSKFFTGEKDMSEFEPAKAVKLLANVISYATGIPVSNIYREFRMAWNTFSDRDHKLRTSDYYITKDSALYDDLLSAMEKKDQKAIARIEEELTARGKSQDQLDSGLKSVLKERYEDEAAEAAKARQEGDTSRYERLVNALAGKTGMNVTLVAQAVESVRKKTYEENDGEESGIGKAEEKKRRLYSMADANRALEANKLSSAQKIIDQEYAYKVDEYLAKGEKQKNAEEKARSSIKASITAEWKGRFLAADLTERSKIRSMLHSVTVGGKKIYTNDDMARWLKSVE